MFDCEACLSTLVNWIGHESWRLPAEFCSTRWLHCMSCSSSYPCLCPTLSPYPQPMPIHTQLDPCSSSYFCPCHTPWSMLGNLMKSQKSRIHLASAKLKNIFPTQPVSLTLHIRTVEMMHGAKDGGIQVTEIRNQYKAPLSSSVSHHSKLAT